MVPSNTPGPETARALGAAAAHVRRYLSLLQQAAVADERQYPPEDLYLISRSETTLVELIGVRVRGHPTAMLCAVRFPRHKGATVPDGRPSLPQYLSSPQRSVQPQGGGMPQDLLEMHLPRLDESVPEFMARIAAGDTGPALHLDPELLDLAFDFRFHNPSALGHFAPRGQVAEEAVLRTIHGHVLLVTIHGLQRTLHADAGFFGVTRVRQLVPGCVLPMPTLALNRKSVVLVMAGSDPDLPAAPANLAVDTSLSNRNSILGFSLT